MESVIPSQKAIKLAQIHEKDPRLIELILSESSQIIRISKKNLIVETKHGFICANAGIDQSNVSNDAHYVLLLPENPDNSAKKLRDSIYNLTRKSVSVIIADTFGRPFRRGQTNIAIGIAGINSLKSYIGQEDSYGKRLRVTEIAVVDELASAAELVMGKTSQIPVVIIRGYKYKPVSHEKENEPTIRSLLRNKNEDLFRD